MVDVVGRETEVGLAAQGVEDVTDVVLGLDALLEGLVPALDDALDDRQTGTVDVVDGDGLEVDGGRIATLETLAASETSPSVTLALAFPTASALSSASRDVGLHSALHEQLIMIPQEQ